MQVLGSDGGMVGRVTGLHGDHLHVEPDAPSPHAGAHIVPRKWVARVDDHVHLNREAALVRDTWTSHAPGDVQTDDRPSEAHRDRGKSWIVWLIGAILLLLIIVLGIRGLGYAADDPDYRDDAKGELSDADREASGAAAERSGNSN
jgi:hypothetical protein